MPKSKVDGKDSFGTKSARKSKDKTDSSIAKCALDFTDVDVDHNNKHSKQQGWIQGGAPGARPPQPPKMRPQHQNSTKLRPQNGSFRP